jgi:hypothetical protein
VQPPVDEARDVPGQQRKQKPEHNGPPTWKLRLAGACRSVLVTRNTANHNSSNSRNPRITPLKTRICASCNQP